MTMIGVFFLQPRVNTRDDEDVETLHINHEVRLEGDRHL